MIYENWLASLPGISGAKKITLEEAAGEAKALYHMKEKELKTFPFLSQTERHALLNQGNRVGIQEAQEELETAGIRMVSFGKKDYPKKLRHIHNPPYAIYYKGRIPETETKTAAVVGARRCSEYGRKAAEQIGLQLAEAGIAVISGMALGIDGAGHRGALRAAGSTYGVLGCGIDTCYPEKNRDIYEKIPQTGGLISEYPLHISPRPMFFPARNRIISGLSDVVIVVEAREKSGSLITADFALEQGREVYAVPGRIADDLSTGTNRLIRQGAGIFLKTEDLLEEMGIFAGTARISEEKKENGLEKLERLVYSCVDLTPVSLEEIMRETALPLLKIIEILNVLRGKGLILEVYKNYFVQSELKI